ncbi:MAG TPA: phosphatidate cytidylyltransferase [Rhizobiales bacterium]|nr:phosphatidate cytidylyltransferase [Hyphomicrobiales bacterium]
MNGAGAGEKTNRSGGWGGLGVRAGAAAVMVPVAILAAWAGGVWFSLLAGIVGLLMAHEWCAMVHGGSLRQFILHGLACLVVVFAVFSSSVILPLAVIAVVWLCSLLHAERRSFWQVAGVPYLALPLLALVVLRSDPVWGFTAVLSLFAMVWLADTLAYFAGRSLGGPKLWPSVSPSKTWSGFFGAVAGGATGGALVAYLAGISPLVAVVLAGAAIGGLEQGGDLFESAAKRYFNVKDSGAIIPGHGGVLDRVDGLMAAALAACLIGLWRAGAGSVAGGFLIW